MNRAAISIQITRRLTTDLQLDSCANCGIVFAMPADYADARRADGADFYCPNGHVLIYPTDTSELDTARTALAEARRELAAARGQVTRLRTRIIAGVCPACHRTVSQMARHIASKHPEMHQKEKS